MSISTSTLQILQNIAKTSPYDFAEYLYDKILERPWTRLHHFYVRSENLQNVLEWDSFKEGKFWICFQINSELWHLYVELAGKERRKQDRIDDVIDNEWFLTTPIPIYFLEEEDLKLHLSEQFLHCHRCEINHNMPEQMIANIYTILLLTIYKYFDKKLIDVFDIVICKITKYYESNKIMYT